MSRKEITRELTEMIYNRTNKLGSFGCFEVAIGFGGSERVDYLTYDTKGTFRCYEVKSCKEDFYSKATWSFVGHYNYFVMKRDLYEEVKDDIPKGIGVYVDGYYIAKRATRRENVNVELLKDSMIRSLYREFKKLRRFQGKRA